MTVDGDPGLARAARPPAVAGSFYPAGAGALADMLDELAARSAAAYPAPAGVAPGGVAGILVPHAGLVYSGAVAAAAWRLVGPEAGTAPGGAAASPSPGDAPAPTIVILGTNHGAVWLDGVGAWDGGPWWTPLGDVAIDEELTGAILELGPPFVADGACHLGEHSIEVQLPFVRRLAGGASLGAGGAQLGAGGPRLVALSVGAGTGGRAVAAGERLGRLLAERRAAGARVVLAISSDMAHYPPAAVAEAVTDALRPSIVRLDAEALAVAEAEAARRRAGVSCGMCGIEPTVLGLAALRAMGARPGVVVASATSADAGGDPRRTVGYLAVAFPG